MMRPGGGWLLDWNSKHSHPPRGACFDTSPMLRRSLIPHHPSPAAKRQATLRGRRCVLGRTLKSNLRRANHTPQTLSNEHHPSLPMPAALDRVVIADELAKIKSLFRSYRELRRAAFLVFLLAQGMDAVFARTGYNGPTENPTSTNARQAHLDRTGHQGKGGAAGRSTPFSIRMSWRKAGLDASLSCRACILVAMERV